MQEKDQRLVGINARSFIGALCTLLLFWGLTYLLTFFIPAGSFARDAQGAVVAGSYASVQGGIPFLRWLGSPILVLFADGGGTIIAIIAFLLVIGGVFTALDEGGILRYMLGALQHHFRNRRYALLYATILFFMLLGAFVGSFEECVPLVPIAVALACRMGWDPLVGLAMSLLAVGCGFATGVCNPFTVGVAQELAGLAMFSGLSLRLVALAVIYPLLCLFVRLYARKIERDPKRSLVYGAKNAAPQVQEDFTQNPVMARALVFFCIFIFCGVLCVLLSPFVAFLRDLVMPLFALFFLLAGTSACLSGVMTGKEYLVTFLRGMLAILPAAALILLASGVRFTLEQAHILDTILHTVVSAAQGAPQAVVVLLIYALVLLMNFFIASGSAKAFLLMPLLSPLADLTGVGRQLTVAAFAFGDGFSNVFYVTNPVLLISLSLSGVSYAKWVRFSCVFQLAILLVTSALLVLAHACGYGL